MNIHDLNKNQIILLALLISFVTSIATGIMTTSLLQEAPLEITRNINRIVEKTIETVTIPATPSAPGKQKEVTTVVVNEEDLIVNSINKNIKSIVRVHEQDGVTQLNSFYGIGMVVNKDGLIATDRKSITPINIYTAVMNDGVELKLVPQVVDKETNFILFKVVIPEKSPTYTFSPATFGEQDPKLGQTLIALSGEKINTISIGRVTSLDMNETGIGTSTVKYLAKINTDVATKDLANGSPVFNLSGDIVGVRLSLDDYQSFTPVSVLNKELIILTPSTKSQ